MMKVEFYILSLAVTIASFSLSIASLNLPQISTKNSLFESNLYFFKKCDKSNWNGDQGTTCYSFPTTEDCPRNKKENENGKRPFDFCDSWLLAG